MLLVPLEPLLPQSLGLQLVVTLTRQLRGKIDARSDGGALFELQFPV